MSARTKELFLLDKSGYQGRWSVVAISVWINSAAYYCFDHPTSLHNTLKEHFVGIIDPDQFELYFGGLYSVYGAANIFLPLISGRLRDKFGDRIVLVFLCILMVIGQFIFLQGVIMRNFIVMYIGRILLGWGIESCLPTQNSLLSPYFYRDYLVYQKFKNQATVVSFSQFFALVGTIICMWYLPIVADLKGLIFAIMTGVWATIFALVISFLTFGMDKYAENKVLSERNVYESVRQGESKALSSQTFDRSFGRNKDIYWLMASFMAVVYTSTITLSNISVGLITERWLDNSPQSEIIVGRMNGIAWVIAAISTPIFGYTIDHLGHRMLLTFTTAMLTTASQVFVWYIEPLTGLILMGLSFGLSYATIWTGVLNVVSRDLYGQAFAYIICLQQFGMVVGPLTVGFLRSYYGTYYQACIFLFFLSFVGVILSIFIFILNKSRHNIIDGDAGDAGQSMLRLASALYSERSMI